MSLWENVWGFVKNTTGNVYNQFNDDVKNGPDPFGDRKAAEKQTAAAEAALDKQLAAQAAAQDYLSQRTDQGLGYITQFGDEARDAQAQGGELAQMYLGGGLAGAQEALGTGYGDSLATLYAAGAQLPGQSRLASLLDGGLAAGFQQDPGYQFRQHQGEEAINRAAAARGGRLGARTLTDLLGFNQDLASQEFDKYAARQMTMASGADQYGLASSGMGIDLAQDIAGTQQQQGTSLADLYTGTAAKQAGTAATTGSNLAQLYMNQGTGMANIGIGAAAGNTQLTQSMLGQYNNPVQYAGAAEHADAETKKNVAMALIAALSDRRLKSDIETVPGSKYERIGLRGVRWTWNEEGNKRGLFGLGQGVIAQEVAALHPQAVVADGDGMLRVDYGELGRLIASRNAGQMSL